jgi:prephenate dehydrogenase
MNITIVGLGLIGGSAAKALAGFEGAAIYAIDRDEAVLKRAVLDGAVSRGVLPEDADEILRESDVIFLALYPRACVEFLKARNHAIKNGALVADLCGVKRYLFEEIHKIENRRFDFIGVHPMAGKEVGGYANAEAKLFEDAFFILVPDERSRPENLELLRKMAKHMRFRRVVETNADAHDAYISYTSQLMHAVALSLCDSYLLEEADGFYAGSLLDCTRVANINETLWSELFMLNKEKLSNRIDEFERGLNKLKKYLQAGDEDELRGFLGSCRERKQKFLMETRA